MTAPTFRLLVGDVRQQLASLPDESVHCVVTSPPYWGLRDYGAAGQLGLEATPELYVAAMVDVFREVRRVLRSDGTLWLNLGDSYFGTGKGPTAPTGMHGDNGTPYPVAGVYTHPTLKGKDLVGIPWRVAFALQSDGWWLRSEVIWAKPNPMPESVTDRPTKAHEQVFLLTKSARYFYDADAVREPTVSLDPDHPSYRPNSERIAAEGRKTFDAAKQTSARAYNPAGRNLRSVWTITTESYPEAHFATYPTRLVEPCVKAGTSEHGCCPECGTPWQRVTDRASLDRSDLPADHPEHRPRSYTPANPQAPGPGQRYTSVTTTGWQPGCGCYTDPSLEHGPTLGEPVPCTVLDPFTGSGTTAAVAIALGRNAIGIELNPDYAALARKRVNAWGPKRMRLAQTALEVQP